MSPPEVHFVVFVAAPNFLAFLNSFVRRRPNFWAFLSSTARRPLKNWILSVIGSPDHWAFSMYDVHILCMFAVILTGGKLSSRYEMPFIP